MHGLLSDLWVASRKLLILVPRAGLLSPCALRTATGGRVATVLPPQQDSDALRHAGPKHHDGRPAVEARRG